VIYILCSVHADLQISRIIGAYSYKENAEAAKEMCLKSRIGYGYQVIEMHLGDVTRDISRDK
jgi:hypothetical protein